MEMTTYEAAEKLGVTQRTIGRYITRGMLPARKASARLYLVESDDVAKITPGRAPTDPLLTDDFLEEVADIYNNVDEDASPRQHIARHYSRSLGTADRWIAAARERGLL